MDIKDIKKTEELAKLTLSKERFAKIASNFAQIINYIDLLANFKVGKYKDNYIASGLKNVGVNDVTQPEYFLSQEQATKNAFKEKDGYIVVPRVIKSN